MSHASIGSSRSRIAIPAKGIATKCVCVWGGDKEGFLEEVMSTLKVELESVSRRGGEECSKLTGGFGALRNSASQSMS